MGNKVVESKLQSIAHTCSAIDSYVVLNSLSSWHWTVNELKNVKSVNSVEFFNKVTKISEKKYVLQYHNFRCGMTHINSNLKKIGITFGLSIKILKKEVDHDEALEVTWLNKKSECRDCVKNDVLGKDFGYAN